MLKCNREECCYLKHHDIINNGGLFCCSACKIKGSHGPSCERLTDPERYTVKSPNRKPVYGFLLSTIKRAFDGVNFKFKGYVYRFEDSDSAYACISALGALAYGGPSGIGTTNDYVASPGDVFIDLRSEIRIAIGDTEPFLVFRKMLHENTENSYYFVVVNKGGDEMPGFRSNKFGVGLTFV